MPYPTLESLPDWVKKMPKHAQEIYQSTFNAALKQYDGDEEVAAKTAIAAVKKSYKQDKEGKWIKLEKLAHPHGEHICVCPDCGKEVTVDEDVKCNTQDCPKCGVRMRAKETGEKRDMDKNMETVDINNVEILAVGTWRGTPETKTYTKKDLDEVVKSFKELTGNKQLNYEPPVKLGHDAGQKLLQKDGYPAAGWIESLKRVGDKLVANIRDVPRKIGDIVKAGGYKKVSSEVYHDYEMGGKVYPLVLKAVSFLGGDIPAVKTLQDIIAQYGDNQEDQLDIVIYEMSEKSDVNFDELATGLEEWLSKVEEKIKGKVGAPAFRTFASEIKGRLKAMLAKETQHEESLQAKMDQVRQAYYAQTASIANKESWVRDIYDDAIIVDTPAGMFRLPFTMNEEGVIAFDFDKQVKVELTYTPVPETDRKTENEKEELMLKELRELYGLPEDATDEQVLEAAKGIKIKADSAHSTLSEAEQVGKKVTELETKLAERDRDEIVAKAINEGKLVPAQKEWAEEYALKDPQGFAAFVEAQPRVVALGEVGTSEDNNEAIDLSGTDRSVASQLGLTEEVMTEERKLEAKEVR